MATRRTTSNKRERERSKQAKAAAKRERRQDKSPDDETNEIWTRRIHRQGGELVSEIRRRPSGAGLDAVPFEREAGHGGTGPILDTGKANFENVPVTGPVIGVNVEPRKVVSATAGGLLGSPKVPAASTERISALRKRVTSSVLPWTMTSRRSRPP